MIKTKALLAALLVAAVPMATLFASCGKDEKTPVNTGDEVEGTEEGEEEGEGEETEELGKFSPHIPEDLDISGKTFSLLIGSVGEDLFVPEDYDASDILTSARFMRNSGIEENFGVTLNIVKSGCDQTGTGQGQATAQFQTLIMSNDDTYHAFTHVQHSGMPAMMLAGNFVDWNTIPYVDITEPWWYQNITKDLCFGDKVFTMTGDYANYLKKVDCLVFNKDIFDELELEYPYQDVLDGTWTWDKFAALVEQGAKDLDGDGLMNWQVDQLGLSGWGYELSYALVVGLGFSPLEKDADNMPVLNQNIDLVTDIYDKCVNLFKGGQYAHSELSDYGAQCAVYAEGRAMFFDMFLDGVTALRDVEYDFGILPYPKYDENSEYQTRSSNMTALTYIPVTNNDLELTGAVLEELAYESYRDVTPVYFDVVLTVKSTRDTESEEMLPIIRDSARFLYDGFAPSAISMIANGNNTYASSYAANLSKYMEDLDAMREQLLAD